MEQAATIIGIIVGAFTILAGLVTFVVFFVRLGRLLERVGNLCTKEDAHAIAKLHVEELRASLDREEEAEERGRLHSTPPAGLPRSKTA